MADVQPMDVHIVSQDTCCIRTDNLMGLLRCAAAYQSLAAADARNTPEERGKRLGYGRIICATEELVIERQAAYEENKARMEAADERERNGRPRTVP